MRCRECRELLELSEVGPVQGESEGVAVELFGLRLGRCGVPGHPPEPPFPDFAADLVAAAAAGDALPTAQRRGWLRSRSLCAGCGTALEGEPGEGELRARVRVERAAPLTLTVRGPCLECPACRRRQLPGTPEHRSALTGALLVALGVSGLVVE
jgi:hypothetical protein